MERVLIIDDDAAMQALWKAQLGEKTFVISAFDNQEAKGKFLDYLATLDAVVINACLNSAYFNAESLVTLIKTRFEGPIIGISSNEGYLQKLLKVGCSEGCEGRNLVTTLLNALELKTK